MIPPFAAQYATCLSKAITPACEAILTIHPGILFSIIYLPTACAIKKHADKLILIVRFQKSALIVSALSSATIPAQFTRISIFPNEFTAFSTTLAG